MTDHAIDRVLPSEATPSGYVLRMSRPRFWFYLAGPVIVGVAYAAEAPSELFGPLAAQGHLRADHLLLAQLEAVQVLTGGPGNLVFRMFGSGAIYKHVIGIAYAYHVRVTRLPITAAYVQRDPLLCPVDAILRYRMVYGQAAR